MNKLILNPDSKKVESVIKAIINNNGYCPCQIEKSVDTLCPCSDFYKGECHCNLYVNYDDKK